MGKLSGKIALITGANSGMGLATARLFAAEGAKVVITARRQRELDDAAKSIGPAALAVAGDVSSLLDIERLFGVIRERYGRLDILFANAGVGQGAPLGNVSEDLFDRLFSINVKGLFFTVQNALPLLSDGASVILNSSIAWGKGMEAMSVYSATKAAVRSFARTWTTDLKQRRIRVNAVSPGSTDTPGFDALLASSPVGEQRRKIVESAVPLGRLGTPDEIAKAVVFLASDDSSYITGAELFVDGGFAQV